MATPDIYSRKFYGYKQPPISLRPVVSPKSQGMAGRKARKKNHRRDRWRLRWGHRWTELCLFDCLSLNLFLHAFYALIHIFIALACILLSAHAYHKI